MWALIIVVIVIVVVAAVAVVSARRRRLQQRFGPEYDRVVDEHDSRLKAEAELSRRQRRVSELDIRPLGPAAQARYAAEWATIQERFVDAPQGAVAQAQDLVVAVMNDRGYPTEHRDQVLADLSVEHATVLDQYRAASDISERASAGTASTEDLRQAMIHYRALFHELLGQSAGNATAGADQSYAPTEPGLAPVANGAASNSWPADAEAQPTTDATGATDAGPIADTRPDPAHTELAPADSPVAPGDPAPAATAQPGPADTEPEAAGAAADPRRRASR
jgi:predicted Zn-dependent protease with MMP-like domain